MPNSVQKRKAKYGGLHISIPVGGKIVIEHQKEVLEIFFNGKMGADQYAISFVGNKNFKIVREKSIK